MGQGILRDFVFIHSIGWGDIAVELGNGHVQIMPCAVRLKDSYKGKLVSWDCDSSGVVTRLSVVSYRRNKILLAGVRARLAGVMRSSYAKATGGADRWPGGVHVCYIIYRLIILPIP